MTSQQQVRKEYNNSWHATRKETHQNWLTIYDNRNCC